LHRLGHLDVEDNWCCSFYALFCRKEQVQKFIECQVKDVAEFEAERDELIRDHEEKKMKLKKEYMEKEIELKKELEAALTGLMEKHKPDTFQAASS
jgi:hypothetical protein